MWVPGYTWAPAWVSWRTGDDDVGWAPLPPDSDEGIDYYGDDDFFTDFDLGFGFHIGDDCDLAYGIGPWCYNFCPIAYIGDSDSWRHFRDRRDNFGLIGRTRNVTNINFRRDGEGRFGRVTAQGPSVAALNAHARTPIRNVQLTSAARLNGAGLHGNTLSVFAPRVDPATFRTARPESVSRALANTTVNRGTDINHPLAVNSRLTPAGATAEQVHAATLAQANVPANARVATANTRISRPLSQPLTALRTNTRSASAFGTSLRSNRAAVAPVSTPTVSTESRFTGEPVNHQAAGFSGEESRYTGGGEVTPSRTTSTYSTDHSAPSFSSGGTYYHPSSFYHASAPLFHSSEPTYYHPQASFHSFAPAPQPHFSAPAEHFSGGGGGRSFGGGGGVAVHASSGGGQSGGGGGGAVHASSGGGQSGGGGGGAVHASSGGGQSGGRR